MGCSSSCFQTMVMSVFKKPSDAALEHKAALERKLYIAKESPEPVFDLSDCQLQDVPSGIYSICKVYRKEELLLNNNKLQSLNNGGQMLDLYLIKILNISCNQFTELTSNIKYLVSLTELYVQNNYIKSIPEAIQHLKCLRVLDVSHNKLSTLPATLGELEGLQIINIKGNKELNALCPELCFARNLLEIVLDVNNFVFPPSDVASQGTEAIKRFICSELSTEYKPPTQEIKQPTSVQQNYFTNVPFKQKHNILRDEDERITALENNYHQASKLQREKFINELVQNQTVIDTEIAKVQEFKDYERKRLIRSIVENEKEITYIIKNFIQSPNLSPEVIQQQIQHEQREHDLLLDIIKQNYDNDKKTDILKTIENILSDNYSIEQRKGNYQNDLTNLRRRLLSVDSESSQKIEHFLQNKDKNHAALVEQVLQDQALQKALVGSLIEQVDARAWSINQEIALVSSNLAMLSAIEQEKRRNKLVYNNNELLNQRLQLLNLIDDLLVQKNNRKVQLIDTLKEMEKDNDQTVDFWLKNYQKIIDSAPTHLLDRGKKIDPLLAHYLLQEGVIHCLPFLVKFLFSSHAIQNISEKDLQRSGVTLLSDRNGIMMAIKSYVQEKWSISDDSHVKPSAPIDFELDITNQNIPEVSTRNVEESVILEAECVVCMDARSEVVFVPCGHVCCCQGCSEKDISICPMCREAIERRIKIVLV